MTEKYLQDHDGIVSGLTSSQDYDKNHSKFDRIHNRISKKASKGGHKVDVIDYYTKTIDETDTENIESPSRHKKVVLDSPHSLRLDFKKLKLQESLPAGMKISKRELGKS